jgi:hypothetical protein
LPTLPSGAPAIIINDSFTAVASSAHTAQIGFVIGTAARLCTYMIDGVRRFLSALCTDWVALQYANSELAPLTPIPALVAVWTAFVRMNPTAGF